MPTMAPAVSGEAKQFYDAFLSYSHAADERLCPSIQHALQGFAKKWYRLRALRVFRDKTSLAMTSELWPTIEQALSQSRFFLLMASPEAAQSKWVQKEAQWWLDHRSTQTLFILWTDGNLAWDRTSGDFDWSATTALPPQLR